MVTTFQLARTRSVIKIKCFKTAKSDWLLLGQLVLSQNSSPDLPMNVCDRAVGTSQSGQPWGWPGF